MREFTNLQNGKIDRVAAELAHDRPHLSPDLQTRIGVCVALVHRPVDEYERLRQMGLVPIFTIPEDSGASETQGESDPEVIIDESTDVAEALITAWLVEWQNRIPKFEDRRKVDRIGGAFVIRRDGVPLVRALLPDYAITDKSQELVSWTGTRLSPEGMNAIGAGGFKFRLNLSYGPDYWSKYGEGAKARKTRLGRLNPVTERRIREANQIINTTTVLDKDLFPGQLLFRTPEGRRLADGTIVEPNRE